MSKKTRIIILSILAILIVVVLSIGITTAFMKPVEQGGNLTEISLSSCAKIKLTGTSSVNLSNSYPMSRNRGFQTTPYSFTVTSYCETFVGFNLYIATLNTNTIEASNIRYILTSKGSKDVVSEGLLSEATNGASDFDDASKTELNAGLKGTYGNIYKIYNDSISLKGNKEYDLYLFVDENATNTTMGKTFSAGVAVKSYDREKAMASNVCLNGQTLADCITELGSYDPLETNIYYHDSSLTNGAGDNSYRYSGGDYVLTNEGKAAGASMMIGYDNTVTTALIDFYCNGTKQFVGYSCNTSQTHYYLIKGDTTQYQTYSEALSTSVEKGYLTKDNVKNFVCFGSDASPCPTENLYRIIGVFNNQVKLIKYDYAKSSLLGTDGDFGVEDTSNYYSGHPEESSASNSLYYWNNNVNYSNIWSESNLNKTNLNINFINNIGTIWASKIATTTWKVEGGIESNIIGSIPSIVYQNEVGANSSTTTYNAKIGLMYVSDYYYAASPSSWTLMGYNRDATKGYKFSKGENWLYGGRWDWTISRNSEDYFYVFSVSNFSDVGANRVIFRGGVRPSFNLESSTTYVSGSGTMSDPIRIN